MKKYKNTGCILLIAYVVIVVVMGIFIINGGIRITSKVKSKDSDMAKYIGDTIIIKRDTLIITNYDIIKDCFYLSNGSTISPNLIKRSTY